MTIATISSDVATSNSPGLWPQLPGLDIAASYREPRIGGDFFDLVRSDRYVFVMMTDIAGDLDATQRIGASVKEMFRQHAAALIDQPMLNEPEAAVELLRVINGAIIAASGGVRCSPTFLAIYNLTLHLITYISAGAPAAVAFNDGRIKILESTGIPLGLFTHLTHDPLPLAVSENSRLVLVSKGVLERRRGKDEFGIRGVCDILKQHEDASAEKITALVLQAAENFGDPRPAHLPRPRLSFAALDSTEGEQDMTVLTLARR
jgi:serine phosphatase RsbU (regulator of sigma subunit)